MSAWVPSGGIRSYTRLGTAGTIDHTDYMGGSATRERGQRVPGVAKVVRDEPTAFITRRPPNDVTFPHFHELNQFQLFVEGHGRIGKHPLQPDTVHYADAFTPYGPIVASDDEGLAFMTLRAQTSNGGAFRMPGSRSQLERRAGRALTVLADTSAVPDRMEELIPLTEDGVEATMLPVAAGATVTPTDRVPSRDRFLVVMSGSLAGDGLGRYACRFLPAGESVPALTGGSGGAGVLFLAFAARS